MYVLNENVLRTKNQHYYNVLETLGQGCSQEDGFFFSIFFFFSCCCCCCCVFLDIRIIDTDIIFVCIDSNIHYIQNIVSCCSYLWLMFVCLVM